MYRTIFFFFLQEHIDDENFEKEDSKKELNLSSDNGPVIHAQETIDKVNENVEEITTQNDEILPEVEEIQENNEINTSGDNIVQDEKSSSFPFGEVVPSDLASYNAAVIENVPQTDSIDNLLANLAEDNANSLPSAVDDSEFILNLPSEPIASNENQENVPEETELVDDNTEVVTAKDTNEEIIENEVVLTDVIEPMEVTDAPTIIVEESKSDVAIAEDLQNGENSDDTRVDIDAEMVSEDELPAPTQEKVDDAEEVSDEELPGPKLAELPADTEVVSEDELPSSNKVKRKVDEGYDPGSPTESSEVPEKKAKSDEIGMFFLKIILTCFLL